jgi:GT2 family glycosyltransferase
MPDDPLPIFDPIIDDPPPLSSDILPEEAEGFDEAAYLMAFPDVVEAIERQELASGLDHYRMAGRAEGRLQRPEYRQQVEVPPLVVYARPAPPGAGTSSASVRDAASPFAGSTPAASIDAIVVSESSAIFFVGWADDRRDPLAELRLRFASGVERRFRRFPRLRRLDVEEALGSGAPFHYGVWTFAAPAGQTMAGQIMPGRIAGEGPCTVTFRFASGAVTELSKTPTLAADTALRDTVMGHFSAAKYHGNRWVESFASLDGEAGDALVAFNRTICDRITSGAVAERFGPRRRRVKGSIVVPLYGRHQYFFLQSSAYANLPGIEDYEFIYVVNSPELIEVLQREARIAETAYGLSQTLVFLPDNAGFGGANNVALRFAQGSRILCVNPDVFPLDPAWARRHTELVASLPEAQTRLFGTTLYYDDGSLMHGGMHFESDISITNRPDGIARRALLRVEHYGKGAPAWATQFTRSRPVPAVSGAFISADRAWFEQLGGFNEDYVFGHYEDADLCLTSLQAGFPAWMHDIRMWHLEGKGSTRRPPHEGGSLLNRWLFSRKWEAFLTPDLLGKAPRHAALQVDTAPAAVAVPARRARGR